MMRSLSFLLRSVVVCRAQFFFLSHKSNRFCESIFAHSTQSSQHELEHIRRLHDFAQFQCVVSRILFRSHTMAANYELNRIRFYFHRLSRITKLVFQTQQPFKLNIGGRIPYSM